MRIIMIGESGTTGHALAERLGVPLVGDAAEAATHPDGFVLAGQPVSLESARDLDQRLSRIAADVDAAVWFRHDDPDRGADAHREILEHYRHRVVEVDLAFTDDPLEGVLFGLHESLVAQ